MDELSKLSPASRERNLDELPRKELQQLAKEAGVKVIACQTLLLHIHGLCSAANIADYRATSKARRSFKVY